MTPHLDPYHLPVPMIEKSGKRKKGRGGKRPEDKEGDEHDRLRSRTIAASLTTISIKRIIGIAKTPFTF
jgi:hypothetical protein